MDELYEYDFDSVQLETIGLILDWYAAENPGEHLNEIDAIRENPNELDEDAMMFLDELTLNITDNEIVIEGVNNEIVDQIYWEV